MARNTKAVCKMCRREGDKLFLKGRKCETAKCAFTKRPTPPGEHPYRRGRRSEFGLQLREKQKVKRFYGVLDKQFRRYFSMADRQKGNTGENFLILLERRLDNIVYALRFGLSRPHARQLVAHGHINVNGRRCDKAARLLKQGDRVEIRGEKARKAVKENFEVTRGRDVPGWLALDEENLVGTVTQLPTREDVAIVTEEQLIVEFSSK
jgi:small subunit ribosomal protein S4